VGTAFSIGGELKRVAHLRSKREYNNHNLGIQKATQESSKGGCEAHFITSQEEKKCNGSGREIVSDRFHESQAGEIQSGSQFLLRNDEKKYLPYLKKKRLATTTTINVG